MMIENNDIGEALCSTIFYEYECDRIVNVDPKGLGIRRLDILNQPQLCYSKNISKKNI